jgi:lipoate synthase
MTDTVRAELIELCDDELDAVAAGAYYCPSKTYYPTTKYYPTTNYYPNKSYSYSKS